MKKTFIIVMLIALLAVTPVLAKSSMENYLSVNTGVGFQTTSYTDDSDNTTKYTITSLPISVSDYMFFDAKSSLGLYLDAGVNIALTGKTTVNGTEGDPRDLGYDDGSYPTYFDMTVGAAYRMDLAKTMQLFLSAGFEMSTKTTKSSGAAFGITATGKINEFYGGLGVKGNIVMNLSDNLKLQAGAKMSFWFISSKKYTYTTNLGVNGSKKTTQDGYFSFSVAPEVSLTYVF